MADIHPPGSRAGMRRRPFAAVPPPVSGRSVPVRLEIPPVELTADIMTIGLRADGNLAVPPPTSEATVWWYRGSPTPGELGSAVIVGHTGAGVFGKLRLVRPGDEVAVGRADTSRISFAVAGIAVYPKDHFPGDRLRGPRDYPALTLMTCGPGTNLIVFAREAPA